jgi:hypothetical protein
METSSWTAVTVLRGYVARVTRADRVLDLTIGRQTI